MTTGHQHTLQICDMQYLSSLEVLCDKLNNMLIGEIQIQNRKCLEILTQILKTKESNISRVKQDNRAELTAKMIELEHINADILHNNPRASGVSLELSSELTYELFLEKLEEKEEQLIQEKKKFETFLRSLEEKFNQCCKIIQEAVKAEDQEFFKKVKFSDEKFRDMLSLRTQSPERPISFALREALINERDEKRRKLVAQMFVTKDREHTELCTDNGKANADIIDKYST